MGKIRAAKERASLGKCRAAETRANGHTVAMQASFGHVLRARRPQLRGRWEDFLRIEKINSPLANPDALVFLIDWTLDEVFTALDNRPTISRCDAEGARARVGCPCGRNPFLAYFAAGEQALTEAMVLAQAATPALDPTERDAAFAALSVAVREISRREIESFCAICQYRPAALGDHPLEQPAAPLQLEAGPCRRSR